MRQIAAISASLDKFDQMLRQDLLWPATSLPWTVDSAEVAHPLPHSNQQNVTTARSSQRCPRHSPAQRDSVTIVRAWLRQGCWLKLIASVGMRSRTIMTTSRGEELRKSLLRRIGHEVIWSAMPKSVKFVVQSHLAAWVYFEFDGAIRTLSRDEVDIFKGTFQQCAGAQTAGDSGRANCIKRIEEATAFLFG